MKTADEIFKEMKAVFTAETGHEMSDDCDMGVRIYASACQAEALYIYGQWVLRQYFPQSAEGEYLDSHASVRGLKRKSASKAEGVLRFSVSSPAAMDIYVPAGTVCVTADGTGFVTVANGTIPQGETICTVAAEAVDAGKDGNVPSKTVKFMTQAPVGVEACTNPYAFTGGADEESDDELRDRVLESYKTIPNGSNAAWYEKTALGVSGVYSAKAIPCARGAGTVDVVIATASGVPSAALIALVQAEFEGKKELGVDVLVKAPGTVNLNIDVDVKVKTGFNASEVLKSVEAALTGLFTGKLLGETLYMAELYERIYHVAGVESYKVNKPSSSYTAAAGTLLRMGTVSVGRWK